MRENRNQIKKEIVLNIEKIFTNEDKPSNNNHNIDYMEYSNSSPNFLLPLKTQLEAAKKKRIISVILLSNYLISQYTQEIIIKFKKKKTIKAIRNPLH